MTECGRKCVSKLLSSCLIGHCIGLGILTDMLYEDVVSVCF